MTFFFLNGLTAYLVRFVGFARVRGAASVVGWARRCGGSTPRGEGRRLWGLRRGPSVLGGAAERSPVLSFVFYDARCAGVLEFSHACGHPAWRSSEHCHDICYRVDGGCARNSRSIFKILTRSNENCCIICCNEVPIFFSTSFGRCFFNLSTLAAILD